MELESVVPHPAQLEDNRDCVLCMTCLKACPHRSVELNLRPLELNCGRPMYPALMKWLCFVVGRSFSPSLTRVANESGFEYDLTQFWPHLGLSLLTLIIPASIPMLVYGLMQLFLLYQNLESKSQIQSDDLWS